MNFCVNCKHYNAGTIAGYAPLCARGVKQKLSLVTGELEPHGCMRDCKVERATESTSYCSELGRFFEPKD